MKITSTTIVGLPVRVARDLMLHFRMYIVSEETTKQFFDALLWREAVDAAFKQDGQIPRSLRSEPYAASRKTFSRIWGIKLKTLPKREAKLILASLLADGWIEPNVEHDKKSRQRKVYCLRQGHPAIG